MGGGVLSAVCITDTNCRVVRAHDGGWRLGVVVSVVGRINEVNQHQVLLVHDG